MKLIAALLLASALLVAGIPYLSNCQHDGKMLALANGSQAPMRCYWTARGEVALAVPLAGLALALGVSRRKETRRLLALPGALLGLGVAALPTYLIGTCTMAEASCNLVMKPALALLGIVVAASSLAAGAIPEAAPRHARPGGAAGG
ncbi:MAG TPA: DUF4418 family protein [Anaerolineae bacterium]|nr:DUF4418 family protein [Anaerolineae bacterium]HOQ97414.1 DUF4418 family protein [Anaerolineae bacterium]HPL27907.1 DUF4418 family protein [Anaerolineae bacterium]